MNKISNFDDHINYLLSKYKSKGLLIDSNLLLVYFIGTYNEALLSKFQRVNRYGKIGYSILFQMINYFEKVIVTPHILTEISNLSTKLDTKFKDSYYHHFLSKLEYFDEKNIPVYEHKTNIIESKVAKFGITDSMIYVISQKSELLVLTDDFPLAGFLRSKSIDVINFNNLIGYAALS